jgi:hypothetical protein
MIINVQAKVSDLGFYTLYSGDGKNLGEHDGYVPDFFPGDHYGDYLILDIDVESGRIVNWQTPWDKDLEETFGYKGA